MVGHDFALTFPFAPGTHGNTNELGWQAGWQIVPKVHPLHDSPFPLSSAPVSAKLVVGSPQVVIRSRTEVTGSHGAASVCGAASMSMSCG